MPELFARLPLNRREFARISGNALAAAYLLASSARADETSGDDLQVALLSDTHVAADPAEAFRGFKPFDHLKTVVEQLDMHAFQAMLICGDAARLDGQTGDIS